MLYILKVDRLETAAEKVPYWLEICEYLKDDAFIKRIIALTKEIIGMNANNGPERNESTKQMVSILGTVAFWFTQKELQQENDTFWKTVLNSMTAFIVGDFNNLSDAVKYLMKKAKMPEVVKSLVFSVMKLLSNKGTPMTSEQIQSLFTMAKKSLVACPHSHNVRLLYNDVLLIAQQTSGLLLPADEDGKKIPLAFPGDFRLMDIFRKESKPATNFNEKTAALKVGLLQYPNNKFYQKSLGNLVKVHKAAYMSGSSTLVKNDLDSNEAFKFCIKEKNKILTSVFGKESNGNIFLKKNKLTWQSPLSLYGISMEVEISPEHHLSSG